MGNDKVLTINEIFAKYGSDKAEHNYGPIYQYWIKHLPTPKKILEIGVLKGASILAWKEIFPNAEIHGLDLFEENPIPDIEGVKFWKGSQTDQEILHLLRKENYNWIIDDGSHNTRDVMVSFFSLAKEGCHYFIEDVLCETEEFYNTGLPAYYRPIVVFGRDIPDHLTGRIIHIAC